MTDLSKLPAVDPEVPNAARMYDYYLGGSHNFAADRAAAEKVKAAIRARSRRGSAPPHWWRRGGRARQLSRLRSSAKVASSALRSADEVRDRHSAVLR